MQRYITIDGGTTNTRVSLVENKKTTDTVKLSIGAQKSIGNSNALRVAVRDTISELLTRHKLREKDVLRILASGMITSEFGLYKVDHLICPIGIRELHQGMKQVSLPDISSIPFVFIAGVRTDSRDLALCDMMRGEETELMGLMNKNSFGEDCIYVLPGSHSKIIRTDKEGKIREFTTMLTGEMIASLSQNTILRDAVDLSVTETDKDYLVKGYDYTLFHGLNEALFKTRILKNLFGANAVQTYSFFMGAVLSGELQTICQSEATHVIIGGKPQIRDAMATLLNLKSDKTVSALSDEEIASSVSMGMIRIFEYAPFA